MHQQAILPIPPYDPVLSGGYLAEWAYHYKYPEPGAAMKPQIDPVSPLIFDENQLDLPWGAR